MFENSPIILHSSNSSNENPHEIALTGVLITALILSFQTVSQGMLFLVKP